MLSYIRHSLNLSLLLLTVLAALWLAAFKLYGASLLSVQSGSMTPAIRKGDLVIDLHPETIQPGEVVSYRSRLHPGQTVTHRVISTDIGRQTLTTKGDNLKTADPPVPAAAVTGKVFKVVPRAGYVYDWLHQPLGLVLMVYLPALAIISLELWSLSGKLNYRTYSLLKMS